MLVYQYRLVCLVAIINTEIALTTVTSHSPSMAGNSRKFTGRFIVVQAITITSHYSVSINGSICIL